VNYFAHAWIASRIRPEPRFVLGAMLPDLAGFLRIRLPEQTDPALSAGIALHHATDAVFHRLAGFRERNLAGIRALRAAGLERGAARAAAHVGIELVLDALLAANSPDSVSQFTAGLRQSGCILASHTDDDRAINQIVARIHSFDPAAGLGDAGETALRVQRTLASRPRLALRGQDLAPLECWLQASEDELAPHAEALALDTLHSTQGDSASDVDSRLGLSVAKAMNQRA
jgi:hypothetical protein